MKFKILYEDEDYLAIDKPSGIEVLDLAEKYFPEKILAHRLDTGTSGVLVLAKSEKVREFLKKQFQKREVKKIYNAIVNGWPKNDRGVVDKPIGRSPVDFRRRLAGRGVKGKIREATTEYKVLKRFEEGGNKFTLVEVKPKTGRTHQIRVHMKFANYPVACDPLYNPGKPCPKGIERLALHAKSVEFKNLSGKTIKVESPLPKEFQRVYI
ncbi:MAG: RluA family pseudouridine synthase [Patescibacteria group bacterium]